MQELASIYSNSGPFSTVYLDDTRSTEHGAHEVELRWRALRESLEQQGCDEPDLAALDEVIGENRGTGASGLVLVAAGKEVVFRDRLPRPPRRDEALLAPLPHLLPYLAQRGPRVPYLVVVADREGADIASAPWLGRAAISVSGNDYPVHKTGRNTWNELHFQHRVENAWAANAREVADKVIRLAADEAAELVILAGDHRARALLEEQLRSGVRQDTVVMQIESGSRADDASAVALDEAVIDALLRFEWRRRRELLEHLQQNLGRAEYAVAGVDDCIEALRRAAVDTLVVSDDPSSTLRAYIGPDPVQFGRSAGELHSLGIDAPQEDRLDSALVRAVVGTGARLVVTPNAHDYVRDGVGALLRY
jgi:release factor family 2